MSPERFVAERESGDTWAQGRRGRFWGRYGAAGLLVWYPARGVLLQHRALWSHHGGTWGIPGGALHAGEEPTAGALREAEEEAGVPPQSVASFASHIFDVGYWRYTTVIATVVAPFVPRINDEESLELDWIRLEEVTARALHPGFARAWPQLREIIEEGRKLGEI